MNGQDLDKPITLRHLEDAIAQIVGAISKALENYPTKVDLKNEIDPIKKDFKDLNTKVDNLDKKVDNVDYHITDIRRRVIDLETVSVTKSEIAALSSVRLVKPPKS